jgi:hypothetical protein
MDTYVEKFITHESFDELDIQWPFYSYDITEEDRNEVLVSSKVDNEVPSIGIETLMELLIKFQKSGADRIYITTNCDHQGYDFYGVQLLKL